MKRILAFACFILIFALPFAAGQPRIQYEVSFEQASQHIADFRIMISGLDNGPLEMRMSRTSPGRYALHEFAKNVYDVRAWNSNGGEMEIFRPDPYSWLITDHDGEIFIRYKLYANRGDGTYAQIDETHAHLNIPASFMYFPQYESRSINLRFNLREESNWKVASQLKRMEDGNYEAPNLQYFMDSPIEISNHKVREYQDESNGKPQTIRFVLHDTSPDTLLDAYMEKVTKIVREQKAVYGEFPEFDFGEYTFLACYIPSASGDGMEHRNSTILTSTRSLDSGGLEQNIGTVSHEFFHAWNVERIRPLSLEPFDYTESNMSGELWFAEGFTSYYTDLILCRSGLISQSDYISGLAGSINYVANSPARKYYSPVEMSYQAPFVDAATSVDPVNRENTFISYYTYGKVLGLALDLSLRLEESEKDLDGYMKLMWKKFGKKELPYTLGDLEKTLQEYAGNTFGSEFFSRYIYRSDVPDFKKLFNAFGIQMEPAQPDKGYLGARTQLYNGKIQITSNPLEGQPCFEAGLRRGDEIISINDQHFADETDLDSLISQFKPEQQVELIIERNGNELRKKLIFGRDPSNKLSLFEENGMPINPEIQYRRTHWLESKVSAEK